MIHRRCYLDIAEFGEVLCFEVFETTQSKNISKWLGKYRVLHPGSIHGFHVSFNVPRGVVSNQIAKEIFWIQSFLEERDWRLKLDSYDGFCSHQL